MKERVCQESKPSADIGWRLEFGKPDGIFPCSNGDVLLLYGDKLVLLDAVSDGLRYEDFKKEIRNDNGN